MNLKKTLSPFIKLNDEPEPTGTSQSATPAPTATPSVTRIKTSPSVDTELQKTLLDAVEAATPSELTSFLELVQSMAELGMDEATQYKSAFAAFQKQSKKGIEALLTGIKKKLAALDTESGNFDTELEESFAKVKKDRQIAEDTQSQIDGLNTQISDLETKRKNLLVGAAQTEQDLNDQRANFSHTVDSVKSIIDEQESKLTTYLSPAPTTSIKTRGKK